MSGDKSPSHHEVIDLSGDDSTSASAKEAPKRPLNEDSDKRLDEKAAKEAKVDPEEPIDLSKILRDINPYDVGSDGGCQYMEYEKDECPIVKGMKIQRSFIDLQKSKVFLYTFDGRTITTEMPPLHLKIVSVKETGESDSESDSDSE